MRFSPARAAAVIAAAALSCSVVAAGPADAATHHPLTTAGIRAELPRNLFRAAGQASSSGAGYAAYLGGGNVSSAGATVKVPSFTCASGSDEEYLFPGIWVVDEIQDALTEQVGLYIACSDGLMLAQAVASAGGITAQPIAVVPGDVVELSLSETPSQTIGVARDLTQGTTTEAHGRTTPDDGLAFIGDFGPSFFDASAVPTFNKVKFSTVTVNGGYLSDAQPTRFNLADGPDTQIKTSAITGGTGFTTNFKNNY